MDKFRERFLHIAFEFVDILQRFLDGRFGDVVLSARSLFLVIDRLGDELLDANYPKEETRMLALKLVSLRFAVSAMEVRAEAALGIIDRLQTGEVRVLAVDLRPSDPAPTAPDEKAN